jgi:salicylate hydroxylase
MSPPRPLEIAIAGCGIAGLASAALLRREGHRVTIFDRLDEPRPIGSGLILQPVGLAVLDEIGVGSAMRALGAPMKRLFGKSGKHIVLDVRYDALGADAPTGVSVHRGALFQVLLQAAVDAGAAFETRREIVGASDGRLRFADGGESAQFEFVLNALGSRSPLSRQPAQNLVFGALWASLDWPQDPSAAPFDPHTLEQRYEAARKMVGVMPIGRLQGRDAQMCAFFWSLKHAEHDAWRAAPIEVWKRDVRALWPETEPLIAQINSHDDLVFAAYAHRTLPGPIAHKLVHVGDSWHCTSPQLGQGANMALLDALALSRALAVQSDLEIALGEYARMRLWHIRLYQLASWMFTPAYQSDSAAMAWLRDHIVSPLAYGWPAPQILAALVAGQVGAPLQAIGAR